MYNPKIPPANVEDLPPYLDDEFIKVAQDLNRLVVGEWQIHYVRPDKLKPGMVLYADGVKWNPGSGEGLYRYTLSKTFVFVG